MRKVACVSVPFIISDYHISSIRNTLSDVNSSTSASEIFTIGIANCLRPDSEDQNILSTLYQDFLLNDVNILARAWNKGIRRAIESGATHIFIHNLDIRLHPQAIEQLALALDSHPKLILCSPRFWLTKKTLNDARIEKGISPGGHMCAFMIRPDFFDILGEFDETFEPAYQEDTDMLFRMRLKNLQAALVNSAYIHHTEGGTFRGCLTIEGASIKERILIARAIQLKIKQNDQRYLEKWGGLPGAEQFKTPFNKPV